MLSWVVKGIGMSPGTARGRERRLPFAASVRLTSYPVLTCLIVLYLTTCVDAQCTSPNCTQPINNDIGGGGTPSFSPDQPCYVEGTMSVNISCDGYLFGPSQLEECAGGSWQSEKPACEQSSCPAISNPTDGSVDNPADTDLYDEVIFSCNADRFLEGPSMAWCQGTGQWSSSETPTCSAYCVTPDIENGTVTFIEPEYSEEPHEGLQISITCDPGYSLTGPSTATCHTQVWNPDVGECLAECASPSIPNSNFATDQGATDHGNYIIVTCNDNFTSGAGSNVSEPMSCIDSVWDRNVTCYANCPEPVAPSDGSHNGTYPFLHNNEAFFTCDTDYTLVGDRSTTCADGSWTETVSPECKFHCELPVIPYSSMNETGNFVSHGTVVTVDCNEGYYYFHNATHGGIFTCDDGSTNETGIECVETCDSLDIANSNFGSIPTPIAYGESVVVECDDNYTFGNGIKENKTILCTGNSWKTEVYCYANCPNISNPDGGNIYGDTYPFFHNESVYFDCIDDTYVFVGARNLTCADGMWSDPLPECMESCPPPDVANSAFYDRDSGNGDNTLHGDYAVVECNNEYTSGTGLPINETIYCDDGSFNETIFCYADCGDVTSPVNGSHSVGPGPHHHGHQANFSCDDEFTLDGNETVTCLNGNWTPAFPICGRDCTDPGKPANGSQSGDTSYKHGSILMFECEDGLEVLGAAEIVCEAGSWSDPVPTCFNKTVVDLITLTCTDEEFTVQIPWSLFAGQLEAEEIVLNGNTSCTGTGNETIGFVYVTSRLDACGTVRTEVLNGDIYYDVYTNNVRNESTDPNYSGPSVDIDLACRYDRERSESALGNLSFVLGNYTISNRLSESGRFVFDFKIYEDSNFTSVASGMPFTTSLGETLYFGIGVTAGAGTLRVVSQDCWATPSSNSADSTHWDLISNECSNGDEATLTIYEDETRSLFSVESFRFAEEGGLIYLHCDVLVCGQTSNCTEPWTTTDCPAARRRRRRSVNYFSPTRKQRLRAGPIQWLGSDVKPRIVYRQERDVPFGVQPDDSPFVYIVVITCLAGMSLILVASLAIVSAKLVFMRAR